MFSFCNKLGYFVNVFDSLSQKGSLHLHSFQYSFIHPFQDGSSLRWFIIKLSTTSLYVIYLGFKPYVMYYTWSNFEFHDLQETFRLVFYEKK